jgi:hypothetical protein
MARPQQQRICQLSMKLVNYPHPIEPNNEIGPDNNPSQNRCSLRLSSNVLVSAQQQVKGHFNRGYVVHPDRLRDWSARKQERKIREQEA